MLRTSMQNAPGVAVLYKLQQRACYNGGIPLSEVTPARVAILQCRAGTASTL